MCSTQNDIVHSITVHWPAQRDKSKAFPGMNIHTWIWKKKDTYKIQYIYIHIGWFFTSIFVWKIYTAMWWGNNGCSLVQPHIFVHSCSNPHSIVIWMNSHPDSVQWRSCIRLNSQIVMQCGWEGEVSNDARRHTWLLSTLLWHGCGGAATTHTTATRAEGVNTLSP